MTLLVFRLGGATFALPVERVHALLEPLPATAVPNAPAIAPALVNVRGTVVPLVDLRRRLRLAPCERTEETRLMVVETTLSGEPARLAGEADAVEAVIDTDEARIVAVPEIGARWPAGAVLGALLRDGEPVLSLDPDVAFALPEGGDPRSREGARP
ncbi:MAG: chemotaxis protein CheW [Paracoccaceae bacterium]